MHRAMAYSKMCPSVLNFLVAKGNVAQYFLVAKGNIAHGANSTYQTSLWCLRNRKRHAVAEKFAQLQFWFRAILFCEENERDKHHNYQGFKTRSSPVKFFSLSPKKTEELTAGTDKKHSAALEVLPSLSEKAKRICLGMNPTRVPFNSNLTTLKKYKFYSGTKVERRNCFFRVGSCWVFIANIFVSPHQSDSFAKHDVSAGLPQPFLSKQQKKKMPTFLNLLVLFLELSGRCGAARPKRRALQNCLLVWWDKYIRTASYRFKLHQELIIKQSILNIFQGCLILLHTNTPIDCMIQ